MSYLSMFQPLEELFKHHIAIALKNTAAPGSHQPATASPMPVPVDDSVLKQVTWLNNEGVIQISYDTGLILGLRPADERQRYFVTTSLIGWA